MQNILELASCDTLVLIDAAYYPTSLVRRKGVVELIAAGGGMDHTRLLQRGIFTRTLTEELDRASQNPGTRPLSVAELHSRLCTTLMSSHTSPPRPSSFPCPLHLRLSGSVRSSSILLAPLPCADRGGGRPVTTTPESPAAPDFSIGFYLAEDTLMNRDSWAEWLQSMPEEVTKVVT